MLSHLTFNAQNAEFSPLVFNVPHFLTRWISMLLGLVQISWATVRIGGHRFFPFAFHISGVFPLTLHQAMDFIRVSSLQPTYLHPFDRPFTPIITDAIVINIIMVIIYINIYICVCMCIYICIYTYIYIHTHTNSWNFQWQQRKSKMSVTNE